MDILKPISQNAIPLADARSVLDGFDPETLSLLNVEVNDPWAPWKNYPGLFMIQNLAKVSRNRYSVSGRVIISGIEVKPDDTRYFDSSIMGLISDANKEAHPEMEASGVLIMPNQLVMARYCLQSVISRDIAEPTAHLPLQLSWPIDRLDAGIGS